MRLFYFVCLLVIVLLVGGLMLRDRDRSPVTSQQPPPIPKDVNFTIIRTERVPRIKLHHTLRLNRKVSAHVLEAIAKELMRQEKGTYERTSVTFYLPEMRESHSAWATCDNLTVVNIFGLTVEEEAGFLKDQNRVSGEVVGSWLVELPPSNIIIYRDMGRTFINTKHRGGSSGQDELVEKLVAGELRFEKKNDVRPSRGEYFLIDKAGYLHTCDKDGIISTARPIK